MATIVHLKFKVKGHEKEACKSAKIMNNHEAAMKDMHKEIE